MSKQLISFTKTSDAVHKRVTILIFGEPKAGKTTLAKTLPLTSDDKLLYVAADPGQLALRDREFVVAKPADGAPMDEAFFDAVLQHIKENGHLYEWIVVDGVDEVADAILKGKLRSDNNGLRAFGKMAEYVETWLKAIRDTTGVNVVFITHVEKTDAGEGEVRYIPSFPGKEIQKHVNEWFDLIGCVRLIKGEGDSFSRVIQFRQEGDFRYVVGDRSGVTKPFEKPDLGVLVKKIHDAGFETKGEWAKPKVDTETLRTFASGMSDEDKARVRALALELTRKEIYDLTVDEFENLKEKFNAAGAE